MSLTQWGYPYSMEQFIITLKMDANLCRDDLTTQQQLEGFPYHIYKPVKQPVSVLNLSNVGVDWSSLVMINMLVHMIILSSAYCTFL